MKTLILHFAPILLLRSAGPARPSNLIEMMGESRAAGDQEALGRPYLNLARTCLKPGQFGLASVNLDRAGAVAEEIEACSIRWQSPPAVASKRLNSRRDFELSSLCMALGMVDGHYLRQEILIPHGGRHPQVKGDE